MPESWMSGVVNCVERDGQVHLIQTGPWKALITFVVCFPILFLVGLGYWRAPIWMMWAFGIGLSGIGAAIIFQARYWRRQGPILSYDPARGEISIPRIDVVIPSDSASRLRIGSLVCTHPEGGQYGAATLEYRPTPNEKPVLVYVSADQNFIERWRAFRASIKTTQAEQDMRGNRR
jgi:hypothetical protein